MDVTTLYDRLHDLELALQVGDHSAALRHARDLRAGADAIAMDLVPLLFAVWDTVSQTSDAELSEVLHG